MNCRPHSASSAMTALSTYDANGNTLTDPSGKSYSWDFENRLVSAAVPGTGTVAFKYDPFGRRIQKSSWLGTTNYLYDGPNLAEEVDNSGNILAKYTQGQGIDQPLSELRSGTISYYHPDGLGSITSLSNSGASVANTYTYDSLGNLTGSTGTVTNPFQYTGPEFDSEISLYYQRARYYESTLGRFLSEDPFRFFAGSNSYVYVKNQSPNALDAFGLAGSHPGSIDGAWNQARMLLSDPDCANFLKTLLESFNQAPDLDFFLHNFDNTNFGFTPANDQFPNPDDYMAHVDVINGGSTVHVSRWAANPSDCCKLGVTLLHEVLHTIAYGWNDFEIATHVGYQGPNKVKPASRYFSKEMESHCVKACQK
ncbi:MAG: RHS repeat-associated core domain-containing protein [Candidatus Acidiferrales bacterium]